ncbi:MAG TPA: S9 family peptidase [Caulobacter sp.]|nr:S9 family peptidase [Caulobacter sp.]
MKSAFRLLAGAALAAVLSTGAVQAAPFTARDLVTVDRVSDPRVSPDGRWVVYALRTMDYEANKASMALWLIDLKAKDRKPMRLAASDGGASTPRWSADSKAIYFLSGRAGGVSQVFRLDVGAGQVVQVTKLPKGVGAFAVSPDGKTLVVAVSDRSPCPELVCTIKQAADGTPKSTGEVHDRLFVRHWDAWSNGDRNQLFALPLDAAGIAGAPVHLTQGVDGDTPSMPFGDDAEFTFTPDSRAVVYAVRIAGKTEAWSTNFDLWQVGLDGKGAVNLTEANQAWDTGAVFSPDGRTMAYRAMKRPGFEADRWQIVLRDVATGQTREIARDWDRSPDTLAWSADGKTLYATAQDVGQTRLFAIDVKSGKVTAKTGPGHVAGFGLTPTGAVYAQDQLDSPAQLWIADFKAKAMPRPLTDHNADKLKDVDWGEYEQFSFAGWNGEKVHGYLVKPANFDPAKKYPVAFLIHGGPQGSFGNLFHYRWNAQTYAGAGYAVVMIDFHGSTGYGQGFTDSISQHWGDRPLEDLQKGWAHALKTYPFLDGNRACALGGSYGGYMVNWIAGNWSEPWKCLVNHDGIFDTRFMGYSTEELWFTEWENGGTPYDRPEAYERFNPVNHVKNWKTPMLVIQGGRDYRVPTDQAIATFTALQRRGVDSRFLYFPEENHWVLKAQNSVQWHEEVLGWLGKHTAEGK